MASQDHGISSCLVIFCNDTNMCKQICELIKIILICTSLIFRRFLSMQFRKFHFSDCIIPQVFTSNTKKQKKLVISDYQLRICDCLLSQLLRGLHNFPHKVRVNQQYLCSGTTHRFYMLPSTHQKYIIGRYYSNAVHINAKN